MIVDESTQVFAALQGEQPEVTLYCFEQVKLDLGFDPEAAGPVVEDPCAWTLEEDYPLSLRERVAAMARSIGWTQERIRQEQDWIEWIEKEERSGRYADASPRAQTQAQGSSQAGGCGTDPGCIPQCDHEMGQGGQDEGDQGGSLEPVPGRGDKAACVGAES